MDACLVGGEVGEVAMMIAVRDSSAFGCSAEVEAIQRVEEDTVRIYVHFHDLGAEEEVDHNE